MTHADAGYKPNFAYEATTLPAACWMPAIEFADGPSPERSKGAASDSQTPQGISLGK
ncbi:hypothetical protein [Mesorhizobium sp.]|uniref:hypothetical protein n=1 Tax=Mesorhizobium sp. TaxID=1871066 RepID=UPI00257E6F81|nr:hypothetical protein [Mesorhizobium sp.]